MDDPADGTICAAAAGAGVTTKRDATEAAQQTASPDLLVAQIEIGGPPGANGRPQIRSNTALLVPLAVASALFMDLLDSSALATALPTLSHVFHTDTFTLKLALTAYLITVGVLVPASGWLSNRIGAKPTFMAAMVVFVVGSICCGLSNTFGQLVLARILQGVGGSMMTPVGRSIVVASSPRESLVKALSWFTLPAILAPLAGPPLAGAILVYGSWRWIFLINVPVGIAGLAVVALLVPPIPRAAAGRFDWFGFLLLGLAITLLMLLLETGGFSGAPPALRLLGACAAIISCLLYVRHALRKDAVVDLRLLKRDTLAVSLIASWMQRLPLGAMPFLLPLLLQAGMGLSPLTASQVMVSMAVGSMAARFLMPPLLRRLSFRNSGILLSAANAAFSALPAFFHLHTPLGLMMLAMAGASLTRGLFFVLTQTLAYAEVEPAEIAHASILFTVSQQLSFSMGVTAGAWLLKLSTSGGPLQIGSFEMPFLVISALAGTSVLAFIWLRPNAGDAMRGQPAAPSRRAA